MCFFMRWTLCLLGPIVFKINGSITSGCHHFSYSNNDHLLSSYLLLDRTCVRCLTYLVLNPLNPTRLSHMIPVLQVRGLRLSLIAVSSWEVTGSRIEHIVLAFLYHPTLYLIISPSTLCAP